MDRSIVYPLAIPYETDFLSAQRFAQEGLGLLAQDILGTGPVACGLGCGPASPASLAVTMAPGRLYQTTQLDATAYGTITGGNPAGGLPADSHPVLKQGVLRDPLTLSLPAPQTAGTSVNYLIQAQLLEIDGDFSVLQFFNTTDPSTPFSGPNGMGTTLPTLRSCQCAVESKAGVAAAIGSQTTPLPDAGWVGLYVVTVTAGQTAITAGNITVYPGAPFLSGTLPQLAGAPSTYCVDTSTVANQIVATPSPSLGAYVPGMVLEILPANSNTGAVTAVIGGLAPLGVARPDGSACSPGDIVAQRAFLAIVKAGFSLQMLSWPQSSVTFVKKATPGASHVYATGDAGASVWRSNSGAAMMDTLPGGVGSAMAAGWSAEIVNTDASALYSVKVGAGSSLAGPNVIAGAIVLGPGQKMTVLCDGTNYTCYGAPMRAKLTANTTLFVATTGSNSNFGIAASSAFLTGSFAYSWAQQCLDLAGFTLTISLAAGTYTSGISCVGPLTGQSSTVIIAGAGAGSTIISITASACVQVLSSALVMAQTMSMTGSGLGTACIGAGGSASAGTATFAVGPGLSFGAVGLAHFEVSNNGAVVLQNGYTVTGGSAAHWQANNGASINNGNTGITITLTGTPAFSGAFASAAALGLINPSSLITFSGSATGQRYSTSSNGTINTSGSGASYLPGSAAGSGSGYF